MLHDFGYRKPDAPRTCIRPVYARAAYLPGSILWSWVSRSCGKLSARDLLALAGHPSPTATTRSPEPPAATTADDTAPAEHSDHQPEQPQQYFPLPGFTTSKPVDPHDPANMSYTSAWNPVRVLQTRNQYTAAINQPGSAANNTTKPSRPSAAKKEDMWNIRVSDAEHILIHEISYKFPDAYQYLVVRLCERAGVPVPDVIRPANAGQQQPDDVTQNRENQPGAEDPRKAA